LYQGKHIVNKKILTLDAESQIKVNLIFCNGNLSIF